MIIGEHTVTVKETADESALFKALREEVGWFENNIGVYVKDKKVKFQILENGHRSLKFLGIKSGSILEIQESPKVVTYITVYLVNEERVIERICSEDPYSYDKLYLLLDRSDNEEKLCRKIEEIFHIVDSNQVIREYLKIPDRKIKDYWFFIKNSEMISELNLSSIKGKRKIQELGFTEPEGSIIYYVDWGSPIHEIKYCFSDTLRFSKYNKKNKKTIIKMEEDYKRDKNEFEAIIGRSRFINPDC